MRFQLLSFSCALIGSHWLQSVTASCYYPDGSFPQDYVYTECSDSGISTCCIQENGMQCLSNGLCYSEDSKYMYRGGCTDKSWEDGGCFQHCRSTSDVYSSGTWDEIVSCGSDKYCCYSDGGSTCCNDDSKVFSVDSGSVIKELSGTATDALPIATSSQTRTSGTSERPSKQTASGLDTTATSKPTTTSDPATEATSSLSPSPNPTITKTAIIAVAAGGTALLLFAVSVAFFLLRRYHKKLSSATSQAYPLSTTGFQKLQDKPELDSQSLPNKSPRPVEIPAPIHSPAPPYQPPQNSVYGPQSGAVEIGSGYGQAERNMWGQPVYEVPAQPWRGQ